MLASLWSLAFTACLAPRLAQIHPVGCLVTQPSTQAGPGHLRATPYVPRQGDLIFYDDHNRAWTALFALAGTGPPLHMGIVVKKPNGTLVILEAGPDDSIWVQLLAVGPRLRQFHRDFRGSVTIRRCKMALDSEHSLALTRFALAQRGKRYAALRLLAQGTAFRVRGPLEPLLGQTHTDRDAWICSELVVAAGTVAGFFDPKVVRSNATYPRDLVDNQRFDLRAVLNYPTRWQPVHRTARGGAVPFLPLRAQGIAP